MSELKAGRLFRDMPSADIKVDVRSDGPMRLSFPASSGAPVERIFGTEVLSHEDGAIRMERVATGRAPLLFNHDWNDPIGMVDGARVQDGRLVVDAHLFSTARGKEVGTMIQDGLRNVSIGYRLHEVEEPKKGTSIYVARDWEPYEVSVVPVPADVGVGIGRSDDSEVNTVRVRAWVDPENEKAANVAAANAALRSNDARERANPAEPATTTTGAKMAEVKDAPAGGTAATQSADLPSAVTNMTALEVERQRREAIANLCKANRIDARTEMRWVQEGTRLEQVSSEILDVMEERGKQAPTAASALGLTGKETQRYSLFKAIRALRYGGDFVNQAGFEIECSRAVAKQINRQVGSSLLIPGEILSRPIDPAAYQRAMGTHPGGKGGYLVSVDNLGFIDILRNRSVGMQMGVRVLSGLQGNVTFARQTGKPSITWQAGDGSSVTAADQTLGQLSMTPKTAIAITDVSEQLLQQSSPSAEAFVMADLAADIAIDGVDYAIINGTGGAQPLGIKNTTGITSGQDAASATYAKILAFVSTAGALNAIRANPGFVTNTAGAAKLMQVQRFTSTDTPLWTGNMMDGQCVGFNAMSSEQLASGNLIFGSWGEVILGEWGVLELATDNGGTRFNQAQVGIRAMWMVDVLVRYPTAFVVSVNLS